MISVCSGIGTLEALSLRRFGPDSTLKPGVEPLLTLAETGDPLLVSRPVGQGNVVCYTSDPAPHWACNLVFWPHYADFWLRCLNLALGR